MRLHCRHLILLLILTLPARAEVERFYIGTYTDAAGSQGIYGGTLDTEDGKLGPLKLAARVKNDPTFLAVSPDGRFLFAALSDAVASFRIQPDGTLRGISRHPSGPNTCHVSLDKTGHVLLAASYDGESIATFPVTDGGQIGRRSASASFQGSGPNHERQEGPHPHSIYADPENRFVYACDLGSDRIWIFRLADRGQLIPANPPEAALPAGSGPRHLAFSADGRMVYVVNELGASTSVFSRDPSTGALTLITTAPNIDPGWPTGTGSAEISMDRSGKWLYVSTRLEDFLTVFKINAATDGAPSPAPLARQQILPSPVKFPRSFALDPTGQWLIVAGQTDNRIAVVRIDLKSGRLTSTPENANVGSPVCVLFDPQGR